jgi:hypothetical protein
MSRSTLSPIPLPLGRVTRGHPAHVIDTEHGIEIPIDGAREILLLVRNDGPSVATVTIRGGDPAVSPHSNHQAQHLQVSPLETRFLGPIDAAGFAQESGSMLLDFTPETVGRISVYRTH